MLQTYCLSHQEEQVLKVRSEQVPLLRKRADGPSTMACLRLMRDSSNPKQTSCQLKEVLAEGPVLSCATESAHAFSDSARYSVPSLSLPEMMRPLRASSMEYSILVRIWISPKFSPQFQATFYFQTLPSLIPNKEMCPCFVRNFKDMS